LSFEAVGTVGGGLGGLCWTWGWGGGTAWFWGCGGTVAVLTCVVFCWDWTEDDDGGGCCGWDWLA
jgi:hypothetical protein